MFSSVLPNEILLNILSFLHPRDWLMLQCVNKHLHNIIANDIYIWKKQLKLAINVEEDNCKETYLKKIYPRVCYFCAKYIPCEKFNNMYNTYVCSLCVAINSCKFISKKKALEYIPKHKLLTIKGTEIRRKKRIVTLYGADTIQQFVNNDTELLKIKVEKEINKQILNSLLIKRNLSGINDIHDYLLEYCKRLYNTFLRKRKCGVLRNLIHNIFEVDFIYKIQHLVLKEPLSNNAIKYISKTFDEYLLDTLLFNDNIPIKYFNDYIIIKANKIREKYALCFERKYLLQNAADLIFFENTIDYQIDYIYDYIRFNTHSIEVVLNKLIARYNNTQNVFEIIAFNIVSETV